METLEIIKAYQRAGLVSLKEVSDAIPLEKVMFGCYEITTTSQRYALFANNNTCVTCGLKGEYYAIERNVKLRKDGTYTPTTNKFHLNLYGKRGGEEIMITKDHIIPKSKGGLDRMDNYQTMCAPCNFRKSDKVI